MPLFVWEHPRLLQPFDMLYALDEDSVRTDYESGYYDGLDDGIEF